MKKNLKLVREFFCKNILKAVALLVIISSTCIIICTTLAHCNYYYSSLSYFEKIGMKSDFVNIYRNYESMGISHLDIGELNKGYQELVDIDAYEQIRKLPAVDKVYTTVTKPFNEYNNNENIDMIFADTDTYDIFNYTLSSGCWFKDAKQTSKYPNAVLCGSIFENVEVGSDIEILLAYDKKPCKIHVIGKVAAPYHTVEIESDYIGALRVTNKIYFLNDELSLDTFGETIKGDMVVPPNAIVKYKDNATAEEIEECRKFYKSFLNEPEFQEDLESISISEPSEEIIEGAVLRINMYMNGSIKKDVIFIVIATLMLFSLIILMVKNKMKEYYIYYFCGCSKKKTFFVSITAILLLMIISGIIGSVYMIMLSYNISYGQLDIEGSKYIFSGNCYLIMWLYLIISTLIACIVPFTMLVSKKSTLVSLYRKK